MMLALTECHDPIKHPGLQGISAAAVGNPILDWTGLFEETIDPGAAPIPSGRPGQPFSILDLHTLRSKIFRKPEAYFDPFASPLLFFRTPSTDAPNEVPPNINRTESVDTSHIRKRRSLRKYPPAGFDLELPFTRLEVGTESVLKDQGIELVNLMRKSSQRASDEAVTPSNDTIESRFELVEREGIGLWDERHIIEIGRWFGDVLRRP